MMVKRRINCSRCHTHTEFCNTVFVSKQFLAGKCQIKSSTAKPRSV